MDHLPKDTIQTIERLHSTWIDLEVAGKAHGLLAFCAEDIELRPPDGPSVYGRDAVLAHLVDGTAQIHSIEISDRHLSGSSESVSLTMNYRTTFSVSGDPAPREATESHRWELRKQASQWLVFLVCWSSSATIDHLISAPVPRAEFAASLTRRNRWYGELARNPSTGKFSLGKRTGLVDRSKSLTYLFIVRRPLPDQVQSLFHSATLQSGLHLRNRSRRHH